MEDISKAKISLAANLASRKFRRKEGLFVAEGKKCVADTLGRFDLEYLAASKEWLGSHEDLTAGLEGRVYEASENDLRKMSSLMTPPDVVAVYKLPRQRDVEEILATPLPSGLYLMLDSIQDPGNLGTILRTAHWFGMTHIFASPMTADIYNPKTVQSTMGSIASVQVDYIDLPLLISRYPDMPVVGLQLFGRDIFTTSLPKKGFIVMGNEGNGLSPSMQGMLTLGLTIPPTNPASHPDSLNVAVATAITIAQFRV